MKLSIYRLFVAAVTIDLLAFLVAFSLRHAKHGVGEIVGSIVWFSLLADALVVIVLAAGSLRHAIGNRRIARPWQPLISRNQRSAP